MGQPHTSLKIQYFFNNDYRLSHQLHLRLDNLAVSLMLLPLTNWLSTNPWSPLVEGDEQPYWPHQ